MSLKGLVVAFFILGSGGNMGWVLDLGVEADNLRKAGAYAILRVSGDGALIKGLICNIEQAGAEVFKGSLRDFGRALFGFVVNFNFKA